jgi:hypothetical protein
MKPEFLKTISPLRERMDAGECPLIPELTWYQDGTLASYTSQKDVDRIQQHVLSGCHQCNSVLNQLIDGSVRACWDDY